MDLKKLVQNVLQPLPAVQAMLVLLSPAALIYGFMRLEPNAPVRIATYVLAFYTLVTICMRIPNVIRRIKRFANDNSYYRRYVSDVQLKTNISLYAGLTFNIVYAFFQLALGLRHASAWFYAMAMYYMLLGAMRWLLVRHTKVYAPGELQEQEWRKYRLCGVCLLAMNISLAVIITYFILKIRVFRHHEITTIAMAVYTFSALTLAIRNVIKYRRFGSPVYSAAKGISLVSAVMSMLTLENAMLTTFGTQNGDRYHKLFLGISGIAVIVIVQAIAVYMIINATAKLKACNTRMQFQSDAD